MSANNFQDPNISHHRQIVKPPGKGINHDFRTKRRKEGLLWMQRSANDQQCHPRELQEKEEEPVHSLD